MGKKSRLKRERRAQRENLNHLEPKKILENAHKRIQNICHENSRTCWEYLVELLAQHTGWPTETSVASFIRDTWDPTETFSQFEQAWAFEVEGALASRSWFSEPIGWLLEEIQGTNKHFDQYFTPMPIVRTMNEITFHDEPAVTKDGLPTMRGVEPAMGTGRLLIDALVFNKGLMMHGIELDQWLRRVAMLNIRILDMQGQWTGCRIGGEPEGIKAFSDKTAKDLKRQGLASDNPRRQGIWLLGGRAMTIQADSLIVDLDFWPNWFVKRPNGQILPNWCWTQDPWQSGMLIHPKFGFAGTWDEYQRRKAEGSFEPKTGDETVKFDFSMKESQHEMSP